MKISELFYPSYGSSLDLNKLTTCSRSKNNCVNFVSRSSQNLGIVAMVRKIEGKDPFDAGCITVTLGGTYLLSAFVQPEPFYTAQNLMVLIPKKTMSFEDKIYYCLCISRNRFKYSAFGREANRTLLNLELPDTIPEFVGHENINMIKSRISDIILNILEQRNSLSTRQHN